MPRTDFFFKVEVEHDESEDPQRLASEIQRTILRAYGVRSAELSNFITRQDEAGDTAA